jgi:hypothetical protein
MPRFVRDNGLSLCFGALFLFALLFQSVAGHAVQNEEAAAHHEALMSYGRYLTSSEFGQAVLENWQSEYLQFTLFILLTVWLVQRGSPESKPVDKAGTESDRDQKVGRHAREDSPRWARAAGVRRWVYSNSLLLVMATIWVLSWLGQSITGWNAFNEANQSHDEAKVSWLSYLGSSDFWEGTLQNWQSEFLAVGSMAIFAVYLRQRGSPESKPVGAPHDATGVEG